MSDTASSSATGSATTGGVSAVEVAAAAETVVLADIEHRILNPFREQGRRAAWPEPDATRDFEAQFRAMAVAADDLGVMITAPSDQQRSRGDVFEFARSRGLILRPVELPTRWWRSDLGPLVATVDGATVALVRKGRAYRLHGGDDGPRARGRRLDRALAARVDPTALAVIPQLPEPVSSPWQIARLGLRGNTRWLVLATVVSIIAGLIAMLTPLGTRAIWDVAVPQDDHVLLTGILAFLLASAIAGMALRIVRDFSSLRVASRFESYVRPAVWYRLERTRMDYFRSHTIGQLAQQANLVPDLFGLTLQPAFSLVGLVAFGVPSLAMMLYLNTTLTAVMLAGTVVDIAVAVAISWRMSRLLRAQLPLAAEITSATHDLLAGLPALRVAGAEAFGLGQWGKVYWRNQRVLVRERRVAIAGSVFGMVWPLVLTSITYYVVGTTLLGTISVGTYIAFLAAYGFFHSATRQVPRTVTVFFALNRLWDRCQPLFSAPLERSGATIDPGVLTGRVDITDVSLAYPQGPPVLDGLDLRIAPGEYVGITGPTGAGKSTILRLLLGFDEPGSGTVAYNGIDFERLDVDLVRHQLGVVTQGMAPIGDTIREAVVGVRDLSDDEVWSTLASVGMADAVRALPMGLDTSLGTGGDSFSGGQLQCLLLARALIGRPAILILDEATSALDDLTQKTVAATVGALPATRIVVAHRLSSISAADRILVVEGGRITHEGSYQELTAEGGPLHEAVDSHA